MPRRPNRSIQTRKLLALLWTQPNGWRHGYDLSKETGLKSGTLYPLLIRLKDEGLLVSKWAALATPGRPQRHLYQLTRRGLAVAQEQATGESKTVALDSNQVPA